MPASKPSTGPNIIVVIFLAVAVLMFAIAAISAVSSGRALARERTAPGSVVEYGDPASGRRHALLPAGGRFCFAGRRSAYAPANRGKHSPGLRG